MLFHINVKLKMPNVHFFLNLQVYCLITLKIFLSISLDIRTYRYGGFRPLTSYSETILIERFFLPSGTTFSIEMVSIPFFITASFTITSSAKVNFLVNLRKAIP